MSGTTPEIITEYEVLFAVRTGITILLPKSPVFDCAVDVPVCFCVDPARPGDLTIRARDKQAVIRNLRPDHLEEAMERGTIMLYEMVDEEVVRCTPCRRAQKTGATC